MIDNDPSAADPLGQIAGEYLEALRQGKHPSVEAFAQRYAERADDIRDMRPALGLMEQAKSGEDARGRRQGDAAPLGQLRDSQTLREVRRGGRGRVSSDRQRKEQLRAPVRNTQVGSCRSVRREGHIARRAQANRRNLLRSDTPEQFRAKAESAEVQSTEASNCRNGA